MEVKSSGFVVKWPQLKPHFCFTMWTCANFWHLNVDEKEVIIVDRNFIGIEQTWMQRSRIHFWLGEYRRREWVPSALWNAWHLSPINRTLRWIQNNKHIYRSISGYRIIRFIGAYLVKGFKIKESFEENGVFVSKDSGYRPSYSLRGMNIGCTMSESISE